MDLFVSVVGQLAGHFEMSMNILPPLTVKTAGLSLFQEEFYSV